MKYIILRFSLNKPDGQEGLNRGCRMNSHELLPVERLSSGVWADVAEVHGETSWVSRLAELGVRAGCRLQVLQPGSPCLLQVGGSRLSLRPELAMQILVRPVALS